MYIALLFTAPKVSVLYSKVFIFLYDNRMTNVLFIVLTIVASLMVTALIYMYMTNDIETLAFCLAPFVTLLLVAVLIDYIVRRAKQRWNK